MKIKISPYMVDKCNQFADLRMKDVKLYKERGGFKRDDVLSGALAEVGTYRAALSRLEGLSKPDFNIYEAKDKTYKSDLYTDRYNLHVKSQTKESAERYGTSWLMQRTDPILKDPKSLHYLVLTVVDLDTNVVEMMGCIPIKTIVSYDLLGECSLKWFRKYKIAIYWKDIRKELKINQRWSILY